MQQGFEGDVASNLTGDGQILPDDVTAARQFAVGIKTPDPAYNELQRVDTAPAATKGDGMLTSADVIQARRYAAGISTMTGAGGPFTMAAGTPPAMSMLSGVATSRELKAASANGVAGYPVTVPIEMNAAGDETAVSFTLEYDASRLSNPKVEIAGIAPADAVLTVNDKEEGRLTILVDAGTRFSQAAGRLLNVSFDVKSMAPSGDTNITLTRGSVSDAEAGELPSAYISGVLTINGSNSQGVSISGRVLTPSGAGLRNAQVIIIASDGSRRTVMTSSAGYYLFDSVTAGRQYQISVHSRRYRFSPRTIEPAADLAEIDFIGEE